LPLEYPLRPNHSRSVEILGDFTDELAACLVTKIALFQSQGDDPITVFINSVGGSVRVLDILHGMLRSVDLERKSASFITVAVGDAASAAANLLCFGFYAYAYPHSIIHFHGVRTSELPEKLESATQTVKELQRINRQVSRKLARSVIARLIFRYQSLQTKFRPGRHRSTDGELAELRCFVDLVSEKVSDPTERLIAKTFKHVKNSRDLTRRIVAPIVFTKRFNIAALAADDSRVLKAVIKHELRQNKKLPWRIDEHGLSQIITDYFVIREYNLGDHTGLINTLLKAFGKLFLSAAQIKQYDKIKTEKERLR
jgi:ATP-dependent protease ClpP protease subunit